MLDKSSGIIAGSSRYSYIISSALFISLWKFLDLSPLNVMAGFGILRIFLNTEGAREMGYSPWSLIILRFLSYFSMHQKNSSLELKTSDTQHAKEIHDVHTWFTFLSRSGSDE